MRTLDDNESGYTYVRHLQGPCSFARNGYLSPRASPHRDADIYFSPVRARDVQKYRAPSASHFGVSCAI